MKSKVLLAIGTLGAGALVATGAGAASMMHATYKIDAIGANVPHKMGAAMMSDNVKGTITLNTDSNQLCSTLHQHGLGMVSSADVSLGAAGVSGPAVAMLNVSQINHMSMHAACVTISHMLANEILAHPSRYYVIVSTAAHPHGAVRAQL